MATPLVQTPARGLFHPRSWDVPRLVATILWLAALPGLGVSVWLWAGQRFAPPPVMFASGPVIVAEIVLALAYASVGWVLAGRRPRNPIGWAFIGIGLSTALQMPVTFLVAEAHQVLRPIPSSTLYAAWLASSGHLPFAAALAIVVFAVFPDGRPLSHRWRITIVLALTGTALLAAAAALSPEGLIWYPSLPNPFAAPSSWARGILVISAIGAILSVIALLLAAGAIVLRYMQSDEIGRAQLRWIVYAIVILAATAAPFLALRYAMGGSVFVGNVLLLAMIVAGCFLPVAAAVAIMRYRLFEIDLIINRTLVYVPLAAFTGGLFTASIVLSQRLFVAATGNTSDLAIVLTTLIVASAFTPVRKGLETLVDRHVKPPAREVAEAGARQAPTTPSREEASLDVSAVLEAAGYIDQEEEGMPERPGTAPSADLEVVVARLSERISQLEARLQGDPERPAGHEDQA